MAATRKPYQSYILRLWQEDALWRAWLEPIGTEAEAKHFADAESLLVFLKNPVFQAKEKDTDA